MALVTMTEAARQLGYASRSQLRRLRDEGRIDDFRRKIGGRELLELDGLHEHIAGIITLRGSGNVCETPQKDQWQEVANLVNSWLAPECWGTCHPFTAQQLATLFVCTKDALSEVRSASPRRQ